MVAFEELKAAMWQWEVVNTEFKSRLFLSERPASGKHNRNLELAADLTSLANRLGGRIVFGIDNTTRKVEKGVMADRDRAAQLVAHVNRDLCSPPVELSHESIVCPDGDVLVVQVARRKSIPHAVALTRPGGQIRERVYYIRNNQGKQLVTDVELAHMFLDREYPELTRHFSFAFAYRRNPPRGVFFQDLPGRLHSEMPFIMAFQALKSEDFVGKDTAVATRLVAEIFPYAALAALASGSGWGEKVFKSVGWRRIQSGLAPGKQFGQTDIPCPPDGSLLSKFFPDIESLSKTVLAGLFTGFTLPPGSEIVIEFGSDEEPSSTLIVRSKGVYEIRISYTGGHWMLGLPIGHPYRSPETEESQPFGNVAGEVQAQFSMNFGTVTPCLLPDYYSWARAFFDTLEEMLSWDTFVKSLPDRLLLEVHRLTQEIREIVGKSMKES